MMSIYTLGDGGGGHVAKKVHTQNWQALHHVRLLQCWVDQ